MGQTLTHGVYLPDEGERNCYSGLASNWQILDTSVGTIAEHTSALAGKAPLVHTHTKADITDFPAYGNTAGTICEGNDSRLSDARTPVAHTHVTADVTDLLNTTHEWTMEQVCDEGFTAKSTTIERCVTPETIKHINFTFKDKNNNGIGAIRRYFRNNGVQELQVFGNTRIKDGQYDETGTGVYFGFSESIKPDGTKAFTFDGYMGSNLEPLLANQSIGTFTNQWNNLYAKNYYYNGVAWGLDKGNVWSKTQDFVGEYQGTEFSANYRTCFAMYGRFDTVGKSGMFFTKFRPYKAQGSLDSSDVIQYGVDVLENEIRTNNVFDLQASGYDSNTGKFTKIDVVSGVSNANLGTSINKWKSFNGINPGALSLPDNSGYTNISGNITDLTGSVNSYTPPFDGYVMVNVNPNSNNYAYVSLERVTVRSSSETTSGKNAMATIPVIGGKSIDISVIGASIAQARFTPCLGNV